MFGRRARACTSAVAFLAVVLLAATGCKVQVGSVAQANPGSSGAGPAGSPGVTRSGSLIVEPGAGFSPVYKLINGARHTIDVTMYEFSDTTAERDLAAAARRGVRVHVILDQREQSANSAAYSYLGSHAVKVTWSSPQYRYTHQKTVIVDGAEAVIMTANLTSQYYSTSRDFLVVDTSRADIAAITVVFDADFTQTAVRPGDGATWSGHPPTRRINCAASSMAPRAACGSIARRWATRRWRTRSSGPLDAASTCRSAGRTRAATMTARTPGWPGPGSTSVTAVPRTVSTFTGRSLRPTTGPPTGRYSSDRRTSPAPRSRQPRTRADHLQPRRHVRYRRHVRRRLPQRAALALRSSPPLKGSAVTVNLYILRPVQRCSLCVRVDRPARLANLHRRACPLDDRGEVIDEGDVRAQASLAVANLATALAESAPRWLTCSKPPCSSPRRNGVT